MCDYFSTFLEANPFSSETKVIVNRFQLLLKESKYYEATKQYKIYQLIIFPFLFIYFDGLIIYFIARIISLYFHTINISYQNQSLIVRYSQIIAILFKMVCRGLISLICQSKNFKEYFTNWYNSLIDSKYQIGTELLNRE